MPSRYFNEIHVDRILGILPLGIDSIIFSVPELAEGSEVPDIFAASSLREDGGERRGLHFIPFDRLRDQIGII